MAKDFGNIFSMHIATKCIVVVNDYESVKEAFRNPLLNDRPQVHLIPESNDGILLACGDSWTRQRRLTVSTFRDFGTGKSRFQDQISTEVHHVIQQFQTFQSKPVDPHRLLSIAVSNIICSVVFGKRFDYADEQFRGLLHHLDKQFELSSGGGLVHFLHPFVTDLFPALKRSTIETTEFLVNFVNNAVDKHRKVFDDENLKDYIDVYLNELNKNDATNVTKDDANMAKDGANKHDKARLTDNHLLHTVIHLFVAGSETTVTTLRWLLLYMIAYPDVQSRVQREIDDVVGRDSLPQVGDKLPFTEATIMEVQRIATIAPLGVPHLAAADTTLCGFMIPKGAIILPNLWAVHHDQDTWNEPEKFRPQRFLDSSGNVCYPNEYVPFSIGRRACLGEHLAKMELFVFFTHLLQQFNFAQPDGSPPVTFESTLGATSSPLPFEVILTKRK